MAGVEETISSAIKEGVDHAFKEIKDQADDFFKDRKKEMQRFDEDAKDKTEARLKATEEKFANVARVCCRHSG